MTDDEALRRAEVLWGENGVVLHNVPANGDAYPPAPYVVGRLERMTFHIESSGASWEEAFAAYEHRTTRNRVIEAFDTTVRLVREYVTLFDLSLSDLVAINKIADNVTDKRYAFGHLTAPKAEDGTK